MNKAEKIVSSYLDNGYRIKKRLYSYRFTVVVLEKDGREFFLKVGVKTDKSFKDRPLDKMWAREEKFISFINGRLKLSSPKPPFRLPRFLEREQDDDAAWTLQEYLMGAHILEPSPIKNSTARIWIPTIAQILHWFNHLPPEEWGSVDEDLKQETLNKINKHSKEPLARGILSDLELEQVLSIVKKYAPYAKPAIQHGDFVPWHMHDDGFPNVVLVDVEAANLRFRYYDLSYIYHRLYTETTEPKLAKVLLAAFLQSVDDKELFIKQFLPSLVNRAVGGLQDYCIKYDSHSAKENESYLKLQREFLNLVLSSDLNTLSID